MVTSGSVAPILAMRHRRGPRVLGFRQRGLGEGVGQAVRGDGDAADRALGVHRPEPLDDARGRGAEAALAQGGERHKLAVLRRRRRGRAATK